VVETRRIELPTFALRMDFRLHEARLYPEQRRAIPSKLATWRPIRTLTPAPAPCVQSRGPKLLRLLAPEAFAGRGFHRPQKRRLCTAHDKAVRQFPGNSRAANG